MKKLRDYNESHDSNFLEEIIIHPDGVVSGSWNKKSLVIHKPDKEGNEYIPCRGEGCEKHCPRYVGEVKKKEKEKEKEINTLGGYLDDTTISSCGPSVSSCGPSIPSCMTISSC